MKTGGKAVLRRAALLGLLCAALPRELPAVTVRDALRNAPGTVGLPDLGPRYRNAVDALVDSAWLSVPTPAMSGAFTYRFDPKTGTYTQTNETFGPTLFVERPQTIGRYVWGIGVTGQYLELDEFDGHGIGRDPFPLLGVPGTSGPTRFLATPKFLYHLATINVTYGLLDDLDVNVAVPLAATDNDTNASRIGPSGRLIFATEHAQEDLGVGDILVRTKYRVGEWAGLTAALGGALRVPSGDSDAALGTGDVWLKPYLAVSDVFWGRVEPSLNVGIDFDLDDTLLSQAQYSVGVDVQAIDEWLDVGVAFLGHSELNRRVTQGAISAPHLTPTGPALTAFEGLDFARKDFFDFQASAKVKLYRTLVLSVGAVKSLNDDGLRADNWSPVGALEAAF